MPIYVYKCESCQTVKDKIRKVSERDEPLECECGSKMERAITVPSYVNGGFYDSLKYDFKKENN